MAVNEKPGDEMTDFGFQRVPRDEKVRKVGAVFSSVASKYDVMNDLMSFGLHRIWKRFAVTLVGAREGQRILDLACGTGDLSARFSRDVGPSGEVVAADINPQMLEEGRRRLADRGCVGNVRFVQANAEHLPFPGEHFNAVTIAFGLRNVTDKNAALREMFRVLKPGGQLLVLEFSKPTIAPLRPVYDAYSFNCLPVMGKLVAGDADSYRYLAESIRMHPDQATLKSMLETAGFAQVDVYNLAGGIVAVHRGFKL